MRHLRLFPAVRERCGAGCRCGRSALRRKGRERTAPRRQARQGGRGANNLHLRKSNHRITRLSCPQAGSRPPCGTDVRSRGFVAGRCRRALREYPGRHSTGAPCRRPRLHPGVCISDFSRFPRRREASSGNREGGPPAPKARRHGAPDGGGLHGPKGRQRREGEDVIVGHISISLPTETDAFAVRPSAVPNGIRSVPSGKSPCTGRVFACRRRERKPRIGAGGGTGPNLGRVHSAAVGRRRTADIGGGAISDFPGNGRTESSVSGETECDPHFARNAPRSEKHPKRAERFRRRRARLRTSHAMRRDKKATGKRRTYPAKPDAIRALHANRREAETSETRRRLPEKAGPETDAAGAPPRREAGRFQPFGKKRSEEAAFVFFGENPYICTIFNQDQ